MLISTVPPLIIIIKDWWYWGNRYSFPPFTILSGSSPFPPTTDVDS